MRWFALIVGALLLAVFLSRPSGEPDDAISYSQFLRLLSDGRIVSTAPVPTTFLGNRVTGRYLDANTREERQFEVILPEAALDRVADSLVEQGVGVQFLPDSPSTIFRVLSIGLPVLLFLGIGLFLLRRMRAPGKGLLEFGKSRAKLCLDRQKKTTFRDVAGVQEAKEELEEIIEFLKEPRKFQRLGGRIPKGVLLVGPPGTGKTLLARAVAGEASVPFLSISGSDFVEVFVGVGASRVRDLFKEGRRHAPCIIFMDEIDAVGRQRGAGLGGGHDEREQTLNQLLTEMDGFESTEGVILIAATNRPDVLDPALLRPGRFDRHVVVPLPDIKGREGILAVHTRRIPMSDEVDLALLARGTSGFSGAQLANLTNEAALLAARNSRDFVAMADFDESKDRVLMGKARTSLSVSQKEKVSRAYYEAGHALVAWTLPEADPIYKVTIIPRGRDMSRTVQMPEEDLHNYSKEYFEASIAILLAGRCAEEIFTEGATTGASDDLDRGSKLARRMVCEWGMSDALGPLNFGRDQGPIFLARDVSRHREHSQATASEIDRAVRKIVFEGYKRAEQILRTHSQALVRLANALLEKETIDAHQIEALLAPEPTPAVLTVR